MIMAATKGLEETQLSELLARHRGDSRSDRLWFIEAGGSTLGMGLTSSSEESSSSELEGAFSTTCKESAVLWEGKMLSHGFVLVRQNAS